ncbi:MAG: hypothetical protein IJT74_00445 [Bacteroidales bacterium]|nr:hypothetical protein [Bacteroidales bacterium]
MKRILISAALLLLGASMAHAAISVPLYPEYKKATVYLQNRTKIIAPMNYDLGEDKMYYKDGSTVMELSLENPVDSIVWAGEHSFVLRSGKFCEKVKLGGKEVLVQWRLKKVSIGKDGALGMNTQSNNVTEMNLAGMGMYGAGETGSVENFKYTNSNTYFIPTAGGYKKVTSLKHLYKCFPEKEDVAKQYVRDNNLELTSYMDFMRLIGFCLED